VTVTANYMNISLVLCTIIARTSDSRRNATGSQVTEGSYSLPNKICTNVVNVRFEVLLALTMKT
jgi:hypothetical protein